MGIVSILFYLIWYFHDGVIITPDSESYIAMQSDREPGYCLYLWLMRSIFGNDLYLDAAAVLQCVIAGISTAVFVLSLKKRFRLNRQVSFGIWAIQCGLTLLNRFVAARGYSYFNSIRTEALAYSFWLFLMLGLIGILYDRNKKSVAVSLIWAIVLTSIRKQMLIAFVLIFVCCIYAWRREKGWKRAVSYAIIIAAFGFLAARLTDCAYNYAFWSEFTAHTGDSSFILGNEIYAANAGMAESISSETDREIFLEILSRCDLEEYNIRYAGSGWYGLQDHYSNSYDRIKFDIVMPVIREYQDSIGMPEALRDAGYNEIAGTIMREILLPCVPNLLKIFAVNVISGFITTILKVHPVLNVAAVFLYLAYIALFARLAAKGSYRGACSALQFAALVLVSLVTTIVFTSATIYCQMRYMLYNTGLFYQAGLIMLYELLRKKREDSDGGE
ncbi:MAG: hypothetical protein LUE96_11455 [Lachnospiraceae bacterium]|nr:hypothetical protein [Lachnospiraceae bacterium]